MWVEGWLLTPQVLYEDMQNSIDWQIGTPPNGDWDSRKSFLYEMRYAASSWLNELRHPEGSWVALIVSGCQDDQIVLDQIL